jgi:hypothetical protein
MGKISMMMFLTAAALAAICLVRPAPAAGWWWWDTSSVVAEEEGEPPGPTPKGSGTLSGATPSDMDFSTEFTIASYEGTDPDVGDLIKFTSGAADGRIATVTWEEMEFDYLQVEGAYEVADATTFEVYASGDATASALLTGTHSSNYYNEEEEYTEVYYTPLGNASGTPRTVKIGGEVVEPTNYEETSAQMVIVTVAGEYTGSGALEVTW